MDINDCRDCYGAIDLEKLPIESFKYYDFKHATFFYKDVKYYLKNCSNLRKLYNEMIAEELAHDYGIKCSYNDIASYDGDYCSISTEIRKLGDNYIPMSKILEGLDSSYNNLEDIWDILIKRYSNDKIVAKLMDELIDIFLFDIIIANHDRHNDNYGMIENKDEIGFAVLFDNENMLDSSSVYEGVYSIAISNDDSFNGIEENNLLDKFFSISDSLYIDRFKTKLQIISDANMENILKRVEAKIGCPIYPTIRLYIKRKMQDNYRIINRTLNKFEDKKTKRLS